VIFPRRNRRSSRNISVATIAIVASLYFCCGAAEIYYMKTIASLITNAIDVSPVRLLYQFLSEHENIYYEQFRIFCEEHGIIIEQHEFLDLLDADPTYLFNEYSDSDGRYWTPIIAEGYVSNELPGDWDDFGDDQIAGITQPAFGDGSQQQPIEFDLLSGVDEKIQQDGTEPLEIDPLADEVEPEESPDLPDFDTRVRHRPSRSVKELE
jgi:hypothetical protein